MANHITWAFDSSAAITSFVLTKSTDKGSSYVALATVTFDVSATAPNYLPATKEFFYDDAAGNPGDIYSVTAVGALGTSEAVLGVAPPVAPGTCLVLGYLRDAAGFVDPTSPIYVEAAGSRGEGWVVNPSGIVSQNPEALGIARDSSTTYCDTSGMWLVRLVRRCVARIRVPAQDFVWTFLVPDESGPVNIRDIKQLRPGDYYGIFPALDGDSPGIVTG